MKSVLMFAALAFGPLADASAGGQIVVAPDASATDALAASELRHYLLLSTGVDCPVVTNDSATGSFEIGTARARKSLAAHGIVGLQDEECAYAVDGGCVALAGGGTSGNAYAVYAFLEREIGCKWLTIAGDESVPRRSGLAFRDGTVHRERPRLAYRSVLSIGAPWKADSSDWLFLFRNRLNQIAGNFENPVRKDLKGALVPRLRSLSPFCHSLFHYMPPKDTGKRKGYFAAHPDYYTLGTNGVRVARQLCFSNPELRAELTRNFLRHAESVGGKGFLDLSAQDSGGDLCSCGGCRTLKEKYGSVGGPLFDYLLELSPVVRQRFPELIIHFLVYRKDQTQKPPRVTERWPDNLAAVFAPIDDDFSKDLLHPNNRGTLDDFRAWTGIVKTWLWHYPITYGTFAPFGGLERCAADTRLAIESGLSGSFYEHDVGMRQGVGFADLQMWMLLRQFRNPDLDWRALRREFCEAYYGAAADAIVAYDEDLERIRRESDAVLYWHQPLLSAFTDGNLVRWNALFDNAETRVSGDPSLVQRLREARVGLDIETLRAYRRMKGRGIVLSQSPEAIRDRARDTVTHALERRYDIPGRCEGERARYARPTDMWIDASYVLATVDPKPLPAEFAGKAVEQIFPERASGPLERRTDADAAIGSVIREKDVPEGNQPVPYPCGVRDWALGEDALRMTIPRDEILPDRFKFYKLGVICVKSSDCRLWIGKSWNLTFSLSRLFRPGTESHYEVWVSLKFSGPAFGGKGERSSVDFDRAVFVRADNI